MQLSYVTLIPKDTLVYKCSLCITTKLVYCTFTVNVLGCQEAKNDFKNLDILNRESAGTLLIFTSTHTCTYCDIMESRAITCVLLFNLF